MSSNSSQFFESFVPVYDAVPEKWEDAREFLVEHLKKISNAVNIREIGWLLDEELISGKQFIPGVNNNQVFRTVLRKVIDFGSLPNSTTKSVAHEITLGDGVNPAVFTLTALWACATKPSLSYAALQIPYSSPTFNQNISLNMDAVNVNITTAIDYSSYTTCFVFAEYTQEN